jgi:hypothetical protein
MPPFSSTYTSLGSHCVVLDACLFFGLGHARMWSPATAFALKEKVVLPLTAQ